MMQREYGVTRFDPRLKFITGIWIVRRKKSSWRRVSALRE